MSNPFAKAVFLLSAYELAQLPAQSRGEIAFAGRSNCGKSSALNTIVGERVARESKTPGRTQAINLFELGDQVFLADLPGYGFAKVPPEMRRKWDELLSRYLQERRQLRGLVLIMDSRHPLQPLDRQMLNWFLPTGKPVHILLSKADKLSRREAAQCLSFVAQELGNQPPLTQQLFSSHTRDGVDAARQVMAGWMAAG